MKKTNALKAILLLLFLFSFKWSNAQSIPPTAEIDYSFYNRMNYVFNPLEKNRVPYGLLRDFAMEFTDLERYTDWKSTNRDILHFFLETNTDIIV